MAVLHANAFGGGNDTKQMKDIATSHGFVKVISAGCSGDTYIRNQSTGVKLKITECKNHFKLFVNNGWVSGNSSNLEQILISNGF